MMPEITQQEIMQSQGTRLSDLPPWMSYAAEMETKVSDKLQAEMDAYAQNRYESTSNQATEELHKQRELNAGIAKEYQFITPDEYAEDGPRIGKVMTHAEFITRLRNECGVKCWYRDHPLPGKVTLLIQSRDETPQVGCWAQMGQMPEFSMVRFDEHGVPLDERRRGWRTCLLQLILKGVLTEDKATAVFGKATGPASTRYNSMLYEWRNRRLEVTV